jgi:hypothetical protein
MPNPFFPTAPSARAVSSKEVQAIAAENSVAAMQALREIFTDPKQPGSARVMAAMANNDRAFGKPMQNVTTRVIRCLADLSDDELNALEADLGEREAAEQGVMH